MVRSDWKRSVSKMDATDTISTSCVLDFFGLNDGDVISLLASTLSASPDADDEDFACSNNISKDDDDEVSPQTCSVNQSGAPVHRPSRLG